MLLLVLFVLQAGPSIGPAPPTRKLSVKRDCRPAEGSDEVVVCARPQDEFRLKPLPGRYRAGLPRAELDLGGVKLAPEVEQGDVGGQPTNRVMLRLKVPL